MIFLSKKIKAFMAVAKYGTIKEASDYLSLTPSPVSRLISDLEDICNERLFDRNRSGLKLTEAGKKLYNQIRPHYSELTFIEREIKRNRTTNNSIQVYFPWSMESEIMNMLNLLQRKGVAQNIMICDADFYQSEETDTQWGARIVFSEQKINMKNLNHIACFKQSGFTFAKKSDYQGENVIVTKKQLASPFFQKYLEEIFFSHSEPKILKVDSLSLFKDMILNGIGMGIVPTSFIQRPFWSELSYSHLDNSELPAQDINLYVSEEMNGHPAFLHLIDYVGSLPESALCSVHE